MNKTRILLIIAIVVSGIFTIIQFKGKGDSAKSYSLLEEQISSETAVVSELSNELEILKSKITSLSGKIDGVDKEIEDFCKRQVLSSKKWQLISSIFWQLSTSILYTPTDCSVGIFH